MGFLQVFIVQEDLRSRGINPEDLRKLLRSKYNSASNFAVLPVDMQARLKDLLEAAGLSADAETEVILDATRQDGFYFRQRTQE